MQNNTIKICNPTLKPYGKLSIIHQDNIRIGAVDYRSAANYIYSHMFKTGSYQRSLAGVFPKNIYNEYLEAKSNNDEDNIRQALSRAMPVKFSSDELRDMLIKTGNTEILFESENLLLGVDKNNNGKNLYGETLTQYRERLKKVIESKDREQQEKMRVELIKKLYAIYIGLKKILYLGKDITRYLNMTMDDTLSSLNISYGIKLPDTVDLINLPQEIQEYMQGNVSFQNFVQNIRTNNFPILTASIARIKNNIIINTYLYHLLEKKYTITIPDNISAADYYDKIISQTMAELTVGQKRELFNRIIALYEQDHLQDEVMEKINEKMKDLPIDNDPPVIVRSAPSLTASSRVSSSTKSSDDKTLSSAASDTGSVVGKGVVKKPTVDLIEKMYEGEIEIQPLGAYKPKETIIEEEITPVETKDLKRPGVAGKKFITPKRDFPNPTQTAEPSAIITWKTSLSGKTIINENDPILSIYSETNPPLTIQNRQYPTIQHYVITFLIAKTLDPISATRIQETGMDKAYSMIKYVASDGNQYFYNLQQFGDIYNNYTNNKYKQLIKINTRFILDIKLKNKEYKELVASTGTKYLTYTCSEPILGTVPNIPEEDSNFVGKYLMDIRDKMKMPEPGVNVYVDDPAYIIENNPVIKYWARQRLNMILNTYKTLAPIDIEKVISTFYPVCGGKSSTTGEIIVPRFINDMVFGSGLTLDQLKVLYNNIVENIKIIHMMMVKSGKSYEDILNFSQRVIMAENQCYSEYTKSMLNCSITALMKTILKLEGNFKTKITKAIYIILGSQFRVDLNKVDISDVNQDYIFYILEQYGFKNITKDMPKVFSQGIKVLDTYTGISREQLHSRLVYFS